ncbi:MAG: elongation factor Ts [Candidatus Paceibacterota bacterium]|jgi:elongation factor Ts
MIKTIDIQKLREETQLSVMECKKALEEAQGDFEKAKLILKKKGELRAKEKQNKETHSGIIEAYVHASNKKLGVLLELRCETDSVANNPDFKLLAHEISMHIAAMNPQFVSRESISEEIIKEKVKGYREEIKDINKQPEMIEKIIQGKLEKELGEICLLNQIFIKDNTKIVNDLLKEAIAKFGEKIEISHFCRFQI